MKKSAIVNLVSILMIIIFATAGYSADAEIKGLAYFKSTLGSSYMTKHGYHFIDEVLFNRLSKANRYAADDAQVVVRDMGGSVVGMATTDERGEFVVKVNGRDSYKIIVSFNGKKVEKVIEASKAGNTTIDLGLFKSELVGSWIDAKFGLR